MSRMQRTSHTTVVLLLTLVIMTSLSGCAETMVSAGDDVAATQNAIEAGAATVESGAEAPQDTPQDSAETSSASRPEGWGEESHSNEAEPNYDVVFPDDQVNQITITIAPEDWEAMQANMVDLMGEAGSGGQGRGIRGGFAPPDGAPGGGAEGEQPPADSQRPSSPQGMPQPGAQGFQEGLQPPEGMRPGGRPDDGAAGFGFGGGDLVGENPMWVPATVEFEGQTWTNVGVRYKGNSSLRSGWDSGTLKLPLKLDFDEFEDEYPEIDDQRFYGFKQLSLANGFNDASFLRDAAASDILEAAGLPAAETAFYEVVLDYGEGPVTLGLYTMIEVVDDTVVEGYFGSDDGNIYEAEGSAASFAASTRGQIEDSFQKENNRDEGDWSDIEALFDALHSEQRTADPAAWRAGLESIFDVDAFLEWLAINTAIQNWDAYGSMSHNYYLYNDPNSGLLTWIAWDHNEAMIVGRGGAGGFGRGGGAASLDQQNVSDDWPLIRYLLDDPVYYDLYLDYLAETVAGPFDPDRMAETYETMASLIAPYAVADVGEAQFEAAVQQLVEHATQRAAAVEEFLTASGYTDTP